MRVMDVETEKRRQANSMAAVKKFLRHLDSIGKAEPDPKDPKNMITICHGKNGDIQKRIVVSGDDGKGEGLFLETYRTLRPRQSYEIAAIPGNLYTTKADYIFYLSGNTLYTLPMNKLRFWVEKNPDVFRKECRVYNLPGTEVRRHGVIVPHKRISQEFAKGNVRVSVFRLSGLDGKEEDFDFVQEM